jgi:hypothetical protein
MILYLLLLDKIFVAASINGGIQLTSLHSVS